mgnify:FL=1
MIKYNNIVVSKETTLKQVIKKINKLTEKILVVCKKDYTFLGTITDGDIRRFIIKKNFQNFQNYTASDIYNKKSSYMVDGTFKKKNISTKIAHVPLINKKKIFLRIVKNDLLNNFSKKNFKKRTAVILAGGFGKRMRPFTFKTPKSLMLINNQPNLLRLINQLESYGFNKIYVCARYKINKIKEALKNRNFKSEIIIKNENKALGTAGPLGGIKFKDENYLILNSDLVFNIDFDSLFDFHKKNKLDLTICVKNKTYEIPYGVIDIKNKNFKEIKEKPKHEFLFNAGIYVISSKILNKIKKNKKLSMVDFINQQIKEKANIKIFFLHEEWYDIATIKDLENINKTLNV